MNENGDYSFRDYQESALGVIKDCGSVLDGLFPIDPELVLRVLGIELVLLPNAKRHYNSKGGVFFKNGEPKIFIDEYHYYNNEDSSGFTLGEELGHLTLHLHDFKNIKSIDESIRFNRQLDDSEYRKRENQARNFSNNIIFPEYAFTDYCLKLVEKKKKSLMTYSFRRNKEDLARLIADEIQDEFGLSSYITYFALIRWPDRPIDRVTEGFPDLLK